MSAKSVLLLSTLCAASINCWADGSVATQTFPADNFGGVTIVKKIPTFPADNFGGVTIVQTAEDCFDHKNNAVVDPENSEVDMTRFSNHALHGIAKPNGTSYQEYAQQELERRDQLKPLQKVLQAGSEKERSVIRAILKHRLDNQPVESNAGDESDAGYESGSDNEDAQSVSSFGSDGIPWGDFSDAESGFGDTPGEMDIETCIRENPSLTEDQKEQLRSTPGTFSDKEKLLIVGGNITAFFHGKNINTHESSSNTTHADAADDEGTFFGNLWHDMKQPFKPAYKHFFQPVGATIADVSKNYVWPATKTAAKDYVWPATKYTSKKLWQGTKRFCRWLADDFSNKHLGQGIRG